ncbi:MAG: DNA cytosine methyltransferase [Alphaproteobacteria bacterium]
MTFRFIDLFAGIGGIRLPFDELGGRCVFSSEIDKFAKQTYYTNFREVPHGDITNIHPSDIPPFDLLLAGFPCQPFSQAGLQRGFDDARGTLFFSIAKIIQHHHPSVVLLENVKRLKTHNQGHTYRVIAQTLEDCGYTVSSQILAGKDFGVPQNRERIYIVGLKQGQTFSFPRPTLEKTCVGDILEEDVHDRYTLSDRLWEGHQKRKQGHINKGNGFGYSVFHGASAYTNTLSARYYKDGSEILIDQGTMKNPRKLTPREAARLQGFPDTFKIPVSDVQAYKQFGNSVCVPVIRAIAETLKPFLFPETPAPHAQQNEQRDRVLVWS